jgi:hypothetical protein
LGGGAGFQLPDFSFLSGFLVLPVCVFAFDREPCLDPVLLSPAVVTHVDVSHGHQFTGGLF